MVRAFKAVSKITPNRYRSLGMGGAQIVEYKQGEWIEAGSHGIYATKTLGEAKKVIRTANRRKKLPIPEAMCVVEISGRDIMRSKPWSCAFKKIRIEREAT